MKKNFWLAELWDVRFSLPAFVFAAIFFISLFFYSFSENNFSQLRGMILIASATLAVFCWGLDSRKNKEEGKKDEKGMAGISNGWIREKYRK